MRILQISSAKNFGGGEKHFVELCKGLHQRGHKVAEVAHAGAVGHILQRILARSPHAHFADHDDSTPGEIEME